MDVQLNDALKAAFVVDSTPPSNEVKQANAVKAQDAQTGNEEEKKKQQEGHIALGTMSEENVSQMTEIFNRLMDKINCDVEFQYNKELDLFNVKMIDKKTNEVIKEFPPEEMIENMIKAKDWLGAFIDRAV